MCSQTPPAGSFEVRDCDPSLAYCNNGTCTAFAKVGETCVMTMPFMVRACIQGAYCDATMTMQCQALPATGMKCTTGIQCAQGNYCDRTDTCAALKSEGAACMNSNECASFNCDRPGPSPPTPTGTCSASTSATAQPYDVTPRSCGFGPEANGPIEGGIVKNQSVDVGQLFTPQ